MLDMNQLNVYEVPLLTYNTLLTTDSNDQSTHQTHQCTKDMENRSRSGLLKELSWTLESIPSISCVSS